MKTTVLESLNQGLLSALGKDESVYLLGEDILDPYGGAFKVTKGCSTQFPDRVLTTPISEAGLGGVTAGMALRGLRPVLEIMFGDFMTLLADQVINHMAKFRWMYHDTVSLPLVIRTPMGGRRGYGPTHSQSLEKVFLGVPGLAVLAPVNFAAPQIDYTPGKLLENAILQTESPVLFVENKLQYLLPVLNVDDLTDFDIKVEFDPTDSHHQYPFFRLRVKGAPAPTITLSAYGYMADLARQAQLKLAYDEEIFIEVLIPTRLSPFAVDPIIDAVSLTGQVLMVEEGTLSMGWGAEIAARLAERLPGRLKQVQRLAARENPVPAAITLESAALPQLDDILDTLRKMDGSND
jgi:pyruvate/2-oxoglutarate/acetoin dehydrogenase E1 component